MPEKKWTKEQKLAIEVRGRNTIVSASAGSGKTAVLIERIFNKITDPDNPVDVDRLLVVTFTKAAAAEMKERLKIRLEEEIDGPRAAADDAYMSNLIRQNALVHTAQISTIDSFCKKVVSEHFNEIEIDPAFRIADSTELTLIGSKVMEDMLEECYAKADPAFLGLAGDLHPKSVTMDLQTG